MTDRSASTPADETRGLAFASYTLMNSLLTVLENRGVLDQQGVQEVLDATLTTLEHRPQDHAIDIARRLIEGAVIGRAASRSGESDA
jgi:hypothetical protein